MYVPDYRNYCSLLQRPTERGNSRAGAGVGDVWLNRVLAATSAASLRSRAVTSAVADASDAAVADMVWTGVMLGSMVAGAASILAGVELVVVSSPEACAWAGAFWFCAVCPTQPASPSPSAPPPRSSAA